MKHKMMSCGEIWTRSCIKPDKQHLQTQSHPHHSHPKQHEANTNSHIKMHLSFLSIVTVVLTATLSVSAQHATKRSVDKTLEWKKPAEAMANRLVRRHQAGDQPAMCTCADHSKTQGCCVNFGQFADDKCYSRDDTSAFLDCCGNNGACFTPSF
ncbi:hypothetical protein QBC39DRAFT_433984 [Podospora conica]|nr:hypothetical protein QBC39DRAFT_433984 [Schizothecium conicum]